MLFIIHLLIFWKWTLCDLDTCLAFLKQFIPKIMSLIPLFCIKHICLYPRHFIVNTNSFKPHNNLWEVDTIPIPILQNKKIKHREGN